MSNPIEQMAAPWCNQCYTYHEGTGCPSYWEPGPAAKVPVRHIGDMKRRIAELEAENAVLKSVARVSEAPHAASDVEQVQQILREGRVFVTDPAVPPGEIHLRLDGKTVGKIVNVEAPGEPHDCRKQDCVGERYHNYGPAPGPSVRALLEWEPKPHDHKPCAGCLDAMGWEGEVRSVLDGSRAAALGASVSDKTCNCPGGCARPWTPHRADDQVGPVPAGDGAPEPTPIEGYPERPILEQAMEWLVRGQFTLTAQARIVQADRTWDGARFTGDVHGVKPDDWKAAHENLDRAYDALRRVSRMLAEIPRGEFIFKRAPPSLSERIEALSPEQLRQFGVTVRGATYQDGSVLVESVRAALRRLLGEG